MTSDIALTAQQKLYARLNRLIWLDRLPKARIVPLEKTSLMPGCMGYTVHDEFFIKPVIFINLGYKYWGKTLIHEMLHTAEPELPHGRIFNAMVDFYWRIAKKKLKGLKLT